MALIQCPKCGVRLNGQAMRCPLCGSELEQIDVGNDEKRAVLRALVAALEEVIDNTSNHQLAARLGKLQAEHKRVSKKGEAPAKIFLVTVIVLLIIVLYAIMADGSSVSAAGREILLFIFIIDLAIGFASFLVFLDIKEQMDTVDRQLEKCRDTIQKNRQKTVKRKYDRILAELGRTEKNVAIDGNMIWFSASALMIAKGYPDFEKKARQYIKTGEGPIPAELIYKKVPINTIQYYVKEGTIQYTTDISGGGGGGSSIGGAIVGGVIAGDAGAIIGSRQKIEEIKTTTVTHDSRKTVLRYFENGAIKTFTWQGFDAYEFFLQNIPDKDLQTIQLSGSMQSISTLPQLVGTPKKDTEMNMKLKELAQMYKAGLIDDAEYKQMKAKALGL